MYYIDLSHTSHCYANTGIQRACRCIYQELNKIYKNKCIPITWDPYENNWRKLNNQEIKLLNINNKNIISNRRSDRWTIKQKIKGYYNKFFNKNNKNNIFNKKIIHLNKNTHKSICFLEPEIFNNTLIQKIKLIKNNFKETKLCKIVILHDLVSLKLPHLYSEKEKNEKNNYLKFIYNYFDIIIAMSKSSMNDFKYYIKKNINENKYKFNISNNKKKLITYIYPGSTFSKNLKYKNYNHKFELYYKKQKLKKILFVGTIELRKNHIQLLKASELLWKNNYKFCLTLIGLLNKTTSKNVKNIINKLIKKKRPLKWLGSVNETRLQYEYKNSYCTIYPSLYEGYGLPVLESLSFGIPCICSNNSSLKEIYKLGGCLLLKQTSYKYIYKSIKEIILNKKLYLSLCQQIKKIKFKTWNKYVKEIININNNHKS